MRGVLKTYAEAQFKKNGYTLNAANEIEGFLFAGLDAERRYHETGKFEYVNTGGYYHSLPGDPLRTFIDTAAEVQRAMGFQNEKDHPEVAPSQFEINYGYAEVVAAADQIQLYKFICRQVANNMGMTASFLPKPVVGVNGSGMHTNVSVSKGKTNLFWDAKGEEKLSKFGWEFHGPHPHRRQRHLPGPESQRERLSPPGSRTSKRPTRSSPRQSIAVPWCASRSATNAASRVEVRAVAPDANPYMVLYSIFKTGHRRQYLEDQRLALGQALPARQHLRRDGQLQQGRVDHQAVRRRREGPLRRSEERLGRPLRRACSGTS